jgi:hypothetical protein
MEGEVRILRRIWRVEGCVDYSNREAFGVENVSKLNHGVNVAL